MVGKVNTNQTIDQMMMAQLKRSMERNARMVVRLQNLAAQLDKQANGELRDVGSDLLAISKDEEPEPWLEASIK